jgi:hypothetical protein
MQVNGEVSQDTIASDATELMRLVKEIKSIWPYSPRLVNMTCSIISNCCFNFEEFHFFTIHDRLNSKLMKNCNTRTDVIDMDARTRSCPTFFDLDSILKEFNLDFLARLSSVTIGLASYKSYPMALFDYCSLEDIALSFCEWENEELLQHCHSYMLQHSASGYSSAESYTRDVDQWKYQLKRLATDLKYYFSEKRSVS